MPTASHPLARYSFLLVVCFISFTNQVAHLVVMVDGDAVNGYSIGLIGGFSCSLPCIVIEVVGFKGAVFYQLV